MRTLSEILILAKTGEKPEYDELRYALLVVENMNTFANLSLMKLSTAETEGKKPMLVNSAVWQYKENFNRDKRILAKSPKEYLGWNNDPDNPECVTRVKAALEFFDKMFCQDEVKAE